MNNFHTIETSSLRLLLYFLFIPYFLRVFAFSQFSSFFHLSQECLSPSHSDILDCFSTLIERLINLCRISGGWLPASHGDDKSNIGWICGGQSSTLGGGGLGCSVYLGFLSNHSFHQLLHNHHNSLLVIYGSKWPQY
jgi:hypothetical protein